MTQDKVQQYLDNQVQQMGDAKVRPLIQAIAAETEQQSQIGATLKAAQDKAAKDMEESQKRMTVLQGELNTAKADLFEFSKNLAANTESAAE